MKLLFATGPSINTRFIVVLLLSIVLIVVDQKSDKLKPLRDLLSVFVYPVQYVVDLPSSLLNKTIQSFKGYEELLNENRQLKREHLINNAKLLKFADLEKENIRLRSLLDSSFKLGEQVLVAELLSVNLAPYEHVVVVNKGNRFGVSKGQAVLDENGIVGQVAKALPLSSEIILITDPNHAIPVQVNRNGLHTIAIGSGQLNKLNLPFLPNNADIMPGDLLITSGLGGVFPQGYPVAVVSSFVEQPDKPFAIIQAEPSAALNTSRELLIVWNNKQVIPLSKQIIVEANGTD
ncbi:rod shape-determining protein MreC [Methylococcaceae bacterium CS1]|uniref:rod shape-determining protein MreC n=1 Tax=Bathymodiolus platifrons methanotrophic gill symbiont TaxID=113268 RepID=UPI000B41F737|nr:rod shape-determining protein MreC [Bathymodiolus platifrons methanotrophic gill symbiont]MCK5870359.1 rod shape-determining protein MreC [Methyloprofundus sp.]TXK98251.1 rod shape-determining protein MreC [Methylococcaceae bacterium CS4]TXK98456.1 rod shape-determining protein MreC [Methylococcaceae bacterium CS5]TXL06311.1 rod shape-determining protein MreC [Methylococcaceae bacterium CS3]TXL07313.1 rod shape-determining protein MreC [Methylococcaceae bacterium CS1]TXL11151.1 rod shape-d